MVSEVWFHAESCARCWRCSLVEEISQERLNPSDLGNTGVMTVALKKRWCGWLPGSLAGRSEDWSGDSCGGNLIGSRVFAVWAFRSDLLFGPVAGLCVDLGVLARFVCGQQPFVICWARLFLLLILRWKKVK